MRTSAARSRVILCLFLSLVGCGDGPQSRWSTLIGAPMLGLQQTRPMWLQLERIGLVVLADTNKIGAAPSISQPFLETLGRRTEKILNERCRVSSVVPINFPSSNQPAQIRQELMDHGQENEISHLLLLIFSGREHSAPVTLGEETMMTQMTGTVFENTTQVEMALLDLAEYSMAFTIPASATETLEWLDAPIGSGRPTLEESLKILRAQAGQQALDRSLYGLGQWCNDIPENDQT